MTTPFRNVRDTFLHFLSDNLSGITVAAIRCDPNNPGADVLQMNAVNVQFLNLYGDTVAIQQVVIDVCFDSENDAVDCMESVWVLLRSAFYTTLYNYSTPATPVAQKSNIMWDKDAVKFRRVHSDYYTHYSCTLPLKFFAIIQ